ncbi:hypothetical protein ABPG72_007059 [Tetrahymena utriculariae]
MAPKKKNKSPKKDETKRAQADKLKEQGNKSLQNENYQKAIELYTEAIELDDQCYAYFHNRSLAYFLIEKYQLSLQDAIKCKELNPDYPLGYLREASAYLELDKHKECIKSAKQGLEVEKDNQQLIDIIKKAEEEQKQNFILPQDDPELVNHNTMINWLLDGKSEFDNLKLQWYCKNYRGVHARRKVYNKETILFIPKSHLITLEMAKETPVAKKIIAAKLNLLSPKHSFLSTFLLQERKNNESKWKPYLDILPSDYNQFPIFFSEDDLSWLKGSPFQNQVREKKADVKRDYDDICSVAPEFAENTFEDFCWARMTASSRVFGLQINEQKTDAFVPLADMLNHRRPKQTSWQYDDQREGFVIQALEDIPRGEQVYDSYGRKCNSRFFLNYGFINLDNDANEVALRLTFDAEDPTIERKKEMMGGDVPEFKVYRILENYQEQNVSEFMSYLRFILIRDNSKLLMLSSLHEQQTENNENLQGYKPQKTPPISIQNETEMWVRISNMCQNSISLYSTTLKEDKELLAKDNLTQNQRNCVLLRSGEKEILQFYIEMADKMQKLLKMNRREITKLSLQQEYIKYNVYINKVIIGTLIQGQN